MWSLFWVSVLTGVVLGISSHLTYLMFRAARAEPPA